MQHCLSRSHTVHTKVAQASTVSFEIKNENKPRGSCMMTEIDSCFGLLIVPSRAQLTALAIVDGELADDLLFTVTCVAAGLATSLMLRILIACLKYLCHT